MLWLFFEWIDIMYKFLWLDDHLRKTLGYKKKKKKKEIIIKNKIIIAPSIIRR